MGSLIYILYTRMYLCSSLHQLEKFSSNPGKLQFEVLVHLFIHIRDKKNLGLRYCSKIWDAPLSELLI